MPKQAAWQSAEFRTDANDRAADKAFREAKKKRDGLANDWTRAMTRAHHSDVFHLSETEKRQTLEHAKKLSDLADVQEKILAAARAYTQLPKR
jgi:hypothetical protein